MPRYCTVDRRGTPHQGQTLGLTRFDDVAPSHLQQHLDVLFPDGVADHGENNFVNADVRFQVTDHSIELMWEDVRRAHFPTAPSRFQSFFAVDTLKQATPSAPPSTRPEPRKSGRSRPLTPDSEQTWSCSARTAPPW